MKNIKNKIVEYDCLRVLVTILVIIGHCTYITIITNYGGIDYSLYFQQTNISIFYKCVLLLTGLIYSFHMPLFMALSGCLFYHTYHKYDMTILSLIKSKAKRLLIPFVIVSFFYSFPIKYISGYYCKSNQIINDFIIGQLLIQGNTHLWYLLTLFFIFIIIFLLEKKIMDNNLYKFIILLFLSNFASLINIKLIYYIIEYLPWFYMGYCFEPYREKVNNILRRKYIIYSIIILLLCFLINRKIIDEKTFVFIKFLLNVISVLSGCILIYILSYYLSLSKIKNLNSFQIISQNSFGLYLYSDSWNYLILFVFFNLFDSKIFTINSYAISLYTCRILVTTVLALLTSVILNKLKIKYLT